MYILKQRMKKFIQLVGIIILGGILILAMICIKYKTVYEVMLEGEQIGYVENINEFEQSIEKEILNKEEKNIADVSLINEPEYQVKLISRSISSNEAEIIENLKNNDTIITYKYYEVSLNNETKACVDTIEEAEQIINEIKEEFDGDDLELELQISEQYTSNYEEINIDTLETASMVVETAAQKLKEQKETENALAIINDIKISVLPVSGQITSRYGAASSIRKSAHTGLDIACATGTNIKVASSGTVTFAAYNGSYGNLVKVDHGNGVETWYGHCSKIYAKVGQTVEAGDIIAAVGSTGNSTGPHLHFEIRINGNTVNPQNYVY